MSIRVEAPGRVVLFGEHQDYLHLPVIPMAIDKYIRIEGTKNSDYSINLKDFNQIVTFKPSQIEYETKRDYLRSCVKVLLENEILSPNQGAKVDISGIIPIQAGLSSSSALCVAWITFLSKINGHNLTEMEITNANRAEIQVKLKAWGMKAVEKFSTEGVKIDPKIFDLRRITKIPGTRIYNNPDTPDRPQRISEFISTTFPEPDEKLQ